MVRAAVTAGKSPLRSPVKKKNRRGDSALVSVKENLNFHLRKDGGSEVLRKFGDSWNPRLEGSPS